MHEHIARAIYYCEIHLLFTSMVWFAAWLLTSIPAGSATTKHWIWLATSLNFMLPLGAMFDKLWAPYLSWATPLGPVGEVGARISENEPVAAALCAVWLLGAMLMLARLWQRIAAGNRDAGVSAPVQGAPELRRSLLVQGVPVKFEFTRRGPAVDGVLRPHISLPQGIDRLLSERELNAVIIHERTHVRRRDNLIRLIYELGLCALWFHPLVWISGSRLALYRELSCDESVIHKAHGRDLVSALAKLANPETEFMLQASASSFLAHRLARLAAQPQPNGRAASALLAVVFGAILMAGVFETVAHTACCFVTRT
jgi:beta-lactamase regulating signal transducer with metallopeptidase domain